MEKSKKKKYIEGARIKKIKTTNRDKENNPNPIITPIFTLKIEDTEKIQLASIIEENGNEAGERERIMR